MFSSFQGEGPHVGATTLFVRFAGCDLRCRWCDSPNTWKPASRCRMALDRRGDRYADVENPVSVDDLVGAAGRLDVARHRFVSLTGGEPLLQPEAVGALARALRGLGPRVLLETHGLADQALAGVIDAVDVVSMDWKLASDVRRVSDPSQGPVRPFHDAHQRFLRVATRAPEVVVKVVVTPSSGDDEIEEACTRIAAVAPETTLVLQPVTPREPGGARPSGPRLRDLALRAEAWLRDVRVIPQTHPVVGVP